VLAQTGHSMYGSSCRLLGKRDLSVLGHCSLIWAFRTWLTATCFDLVMFFAKTPLVGLDEPCNTDVLLVMQFSVPHVQKKLVLGVKLFSTHSS